MAPWMLFCLLEQIWFNQWISGETTWCADSYLGDHILDFLLGDKTNKKCPILIFKEVPEPYCFGFEPVNNNLATTQNSLDGIYSFKVL